MDDNRLKMQGVALITLTPNSRLARFLKRAEQANAPDVAHASTPILALSTWLNQLHEMLLFVVAKPLLLINTNQEELLWREIITHSDYGNALLQIESTAKTAQQAYQSLRAWNLSLQSLANERNNPDLQAFYAWAQRLQQYCQQHNLLNCADLIDWLCENLVAIKNILPQQIKLVNFDEITPQITKLLTTLQTMGCEIIQTEHTVSLQTKGIVSTHDLTEELYTMARWAKQIHNEHSDKKIMCIVPNLTQIRPQVQACFQHVFTPEILFNPDLTHNKVNISGGYSLSSAPIIYAALQILQLNTYTISYQQLSFILTSPFTAGFNNEMLNRAIFDAEIRQLDESQLSWQLIINSLAKKPADFAPLLINNLQTWRKYFQALDKKQTLAAWKDNFHQLLLQLGWPGERSLNSTEFQQVNRWFELLQELPNVILEAKNYTYSQAVQLLQQLVNNTLFEIQSDDGPIQVLGVLEAAGLNADYCWLMHLDDETWPQAATPNPLLPYHLQRKLTLPHSSAARELQFSQQMLARLEKSCTHIIYSYHRHDADRQLTISPLIKSLPIINADQLPLAAYTDLGSIIAQHADCEYIVDNRAPVIQATEKVTGGTDIFKQQAACPFRAFATHRLAAEGLVEPTGGLNAAERGLVLHVCLDKIWATLQTHANLLQQSEAALSAIVNTAINHSLQTCFPPHSRKLPTRFKKLEMQRLHDLLIAWLALEKQRPPFTVIAHEKWRRAQVANLMVKLQIDRIDELANGDKIVIDYKSGQTNPENWFGERPREPQLPLYCLVESDISGISFAQVRSDEMKFKGISAHATDISGIKPIETIKDKQVPESWQELVSQWDHVLHQLAENYFAGHAQVDPINYEVCEYCDLHSLCRIGEQQ